MKKNCLLWFRKGLRIHDNPALLDLLKTSHHLFPVFVIDPWFLKPSTVGPNRLQFLLESLQDLDANLKKLNSRLLVLRGNPIEILPKMLQEWKIKVLAFEKDTEPYALERDQAIEKRAKEMGIEVVQPWGHTLFNLDQLMERHSDNNRPPISYSSFLNLISKVEEPKEPLDTPSTLKGTLPENILNNTSDWTVPTLEELNYPPSSKKPILVGGETEALKILEQVCKNEDYVASFKKPQTNPAAFDPASTTRLSPYLKFGCLSCRMMWHKIQQVLSKHKNHSKPPESLIGQLLWREFFYLAAYKTPNFDKMKGNPICKQIDWDEDQKLLEAWKNAKTGYPWIDAIMTQLREEGWIHHLARHSVACFLTRGDLYQSWEKGAEVFELWLLDADWSINRANWLWLSASAFFYQYHRVYSPITFGKKYDKNGDYIKKYLPVLAKMPAQYIYEPWKAPHEVQKKANCVIGKDYPKPIVEHNEAKKHCLEKIKKAYQKDKMKHTHKSETQPSSNKKQRKK